jgi:AhpC/TSA family.
MKNTLLCIMLFLVLSGALFGFYIAGNSLPIGSALPMADHKLNDVQGQDVTMKQAARKSGLLVMFSCNTCPYVIRNQERTKAICSYALQNNIGVILLNSNENQRDDEDSFDAMKAYATEQKYNWYYAVDKDNAVADAFGANRTPECFLFSAALRLVYHGAIDDNPTDPDNVTRQHLKEAINELLGGKEISIRETRSVGCGIKRK